MAFDPNDADSNKVHGLDDLNDRLYRRDLANRKPEHIDALHKRSFAVRKDWSEKVEEKKAAVVAIASHTSFFRKFFFFSLGFAVLAVIIVAVTFFTGNNTVSNDNIAINVLGNSFTAGGTELPLQVEIVNKNSSELQLSDLFVSYDKGGDASGGSTHVNDLTSIGTIGGGKTIDRGLNVTLYGTEGSTQPIVLTLQYHLQGSNAVFTKTATFPVTISSSPVALTVDAPTTVTPNQEVTFTVKTKSNSQNTLSGMLLNVQYPTGFKFEKAVPAPDSQTNTWKLGDLAPGAERDIAITGTLYGTDGQDQAFHIYTGAADASDGTKIGVTYNSLLQTISLVKPFITADLAINGSSADSTPVSSSGSIQGQVSYSNNLTTPVTNATVVVSLSGNALDASSIIAQNGFYDSTKNTITWDSTTVPDLATLQPGDTGMLSFSFKAVPLVSGGSTLSSPSIQLSVSIKGKQSGGTSGLSDVNNIQTKTAVISSDLGFTSSVAHNTGPFTNTGSTPPKAGQPTTYTVTWNLTNSANMLSNAAATATLPSYVDWVGTIAPSGSPIAYDETTRTIRWTIGQVPVGTGITAPAQKVSFQLRLNPSTSQVGSVPSLTLSTAISALDTFTNQTLNLTRNGLTTAIPSEGDSGAVTN